MKKSNLLKGVAALTMGLAAVGCSHEVGYVDPRDEIIANYEQMFLKVFGQPASDQDWGFGATKSGTRAAATWDGIHTCFEANWEDKLKNITLPDGAFQLDQEGNYYYNQYGWPEPAYYCKIPNNATVMYLSEDFNDVLRMDGSIPAGAVLYNYGTVTGFSGNFNGTITIYNLGTMTYNPGSQDHNIINTGTLKVEDGDAYSKILNLYNGGYLEFGGGYYDYSTGQAVFVPGAQLHSKSHIYSNGEGIYMPYGGVIESTCDIHETVTVEGDLKIQNSTSKYICGIKATGTVENVDGPFYTSYVKADKFTVDGNETYLLPGGYIKANTVHVYNSGCSIKAAAGSNALIEAKDFIFANDNDFERTVSDNVYFQISGSVDVSGVTNGDLKKREKFDNADAYIAANGNPNDKLNSGTATGSPACGDAWTVGTPTEPNWVFEARVFAEDLSVSDASDFDFNDVVFDVYYSTATSQTKVQLLAAGGTLPITVAGIDVHKQFGVGTTTMINTGVVPGYNIVNDKTADPIIIEEIVEVKDIEIVVSKNNTLLTLEATQGKPAAKFAVPAQIKWCEERAKIEEVYPAFKGWVGDVTTVWYTEADYGDGVK